MSQVRDLHRKAMSLLDESNIARASGDNALADNIRRQAYETEQQAAILLQDRREIEPTRSILYKGAAVLAMECGLTCEAEYLINTALAGNPPVGLLKSCAIYPRKSIAAAMEKREIRTSFADSGVLYPRLASLPGASAVASQGPAAKRPHGGGILRGLAESSISCDLNSCVA